MVRFVEDGPDATPKASGGVAPVIPLFGGGPVDVAPNPHRSPADEPRLPASGAEGADDAADHVRARDMLETRLLRRLRTRQLSVAEARSALTEGNLAAADADRLVEDFVRRGYLDDDRLAEQLAYVGVQRKGHGRRAIAQTLARRRVSREAIDAALALLPVDDAERALEFARAKAPTLARAAPDAALRRLVGQLSRRGYAGAVAMDAAKTALAEHGGAS